MSIKERQRIVLAALLHDIGKFWERADLKYDQSEVIKKEFPNKEYNHVVPTYPNGNPMYSHALWTQAFFNKYGIGAHLALDDEKDKNLANLSAKHHRPTNHLEAIISLADKWSSSIDRPDEDQEDENFYKEVKEKWGEQFQKKVPLENIFDILNRETKDYDSHCLKLAKLNVLDSDILFSQKTVPDKNSNLQDQYHDLWKGFEKEITSLISRCTDFDSFYTSINDILRNYTWCMPSATNVIPANVSLYEHLKTTAAIALSLYDYYKDSNKEITIQGDWQSSVRDIDTLLMVCIDLSGIQKFIYDIANKKAAKSLKGRSFYLNLLMQHIVDKVLNHENILCYPTNVIYSSGGKAYMILPNIERVKDALIDVEEQIQAFLFKEYHGKLFACFGALAFGYETFKDNNGIWANKIFSKELTGKEKNMLAEDIFDLGDLWRFASDRASAKKGQKFKSQLIADYNSFFKPQSIDYNLNKCAVTGERGALFDMNNNRDSSDQIWVLKQVYDQAELGEALKKGNFIISYKDIRDKLRTDIQVSDEFFEIKDIEHIKNLPASLYDKATISTMNNTDATIVASNVGVKTIFYGGNKQPENINGDYKTYEDLALTDKGNRTKFGILRMDVDNLGQIFIHGFNEKVQKKSFAAYSTLSFMLEAFFSGHINHIHQSNPEFKDYVQILYSGGDDLFAVGRWDAIINFAYEVRKEFARFVSRDDISISGGIAIVGAKYPIMKSADLAGDAEKAAKDFNNKAKNAINFFGETVSWDKEFEFVKGMKDSFMYFKDATGTALLQNIQKYKLIKDNGIKLNKKDLSYLWHSAYTLKRMADRIGDKDKQAVEFVEHIADNILYNKEYGSERYLDLMALAARWAEYLLKDKNKNLEEYEISREEV
ncbi:MAG: type III-A CRISPR-associated protein Cas10/Csm1 [Chitinophagales bacterium]|nr:type III-A CRISPR-associated protein Cas10/Csm1 [Chitinophagales bacterium]